MISARGLFVLQHGSQNPILFRVPVLSDLVSAEMITTRELHLQHGSQNPILFRVLSDLVSSEMISTRVLHLQHGGQNLLQVVMLGSNWVLLTTVSIQGLKQSNKQDLFLFDF